MPLQIKIGIIGGTGLDDPEILDNKKEISVDTPYGKPSDVIIDGTINDIPCAILARHGHYHTIMPHTVNYRANIWALKSLGCTHILASTATGSLQEHIPPGSFVILDNAIDRTHGRHQTLYDGSNPDAKGICHIPMEPAFCPRTRKAILKASLSMGIECKDGGSCVTIQGPRFSTKAESNLFRQWGIDIVNMTTFPEIVLAKEAELCYAAIAIVTDYDCWRDTGEKVCVPEVMKTFSKCVEKLKKILIETVSVIASENWDDYINELKDTVKSSIMLHAN